MPDCKSCSNKYKGEIVPISRDEISGTENFGLWVRKCSLMDSKTLESSPQLKSVLLIWECCYHISVGYNIHSRRGKDYSQWLCASNSLTKKLSSGPQSCQNEDFKNSLHGWNPKEALAVRCEARHKFVKYQERTNLSSRDYENGQECLVLTSVKLKYFGLLANALVLLLSGVYYTNILFYAIT